MKIYFLPKTALGKWSIGGIAGSIAFWLALVILRRYQLGMLVPVWILIGLSGLAAFFTGIIGIIKSKDRSVIVFITTFIGFSIVLMVLSLLFQW